MNVEGAQRWRGGRASYRPAGEVIDTRRFEVAAVDELRQRGYAGVVSFADPVPRSAVGGGRRGGRIQP